MNSAKEIGPSCRIRSRTMSFKASLSRGLRRSSSAISLGCLAADHRHEHFPHPRVVELDQKHSLIFAKRWPAVYDRHSLARGEKEVLAVCVAVRALRSEEGRV